MNEAEISRRVGLSDHHMLSPPGLSLRNCVRVLTRHKVLVAVAVGVGLCVALLVRLHAVPSYEAESQVVLDVRNTTILKFDAVVSALPAQLEVVRTEMDVIGSRGMAERVLDHLSPADVTLLADNGSLTTPMSRFLNQAWPEIVGRLSAWVPALKQWVDAAPVTKGHDPGGPNSSPLPDRENLIRLIWQGVKISNDGRSYTIHIDFASPYPKIAALLANTYAEQYLANQFDLKAEAMTRANGLLSQRLVELRSELESSETAVETYRRAAGMLGDKGGTIITQQLSEINVELLAARNRRIEAESRLRTAQSRLGAGGDPEALSDALSSQVVQSLRAKQADLSRQEAQIRNQYTAKYPNAKTISTDAAALQTQVDTEISRIMKSLVEQVDVARNTELSLQRDLAGLERQFGEGSAAEVKLQQLQREADANRAIYEAYLNRLKEVTEQQQLQEADAHLITLAPLPVVPTYPRFRPLLALGLVLGGAVGVALAFLRDIFDQRLHSIGQVEDVTGLPVLALMPSLPLLYLARPEEYVLGRRGSLFNEALRTIWAFLLLARDHVGAPSDVVSIADGTRLPPPRRQSIPAGIVIMVTSSVPNEGKTAVCLSMARSLSADGHKVLLIDGDMRRPGIAKALGHSGPSRMTDLLDGKIELQEAVQVDEKSGAHYLAMKDDSMHPQDVWNSARTEIVLENARRAYDLVLIDSPPILVAADAAIVARFCDHCLFLVRWGATSREHVTSALRRLSLYNVRVSGVVLSHVNLRIHARYATGEGYFQSYGHIRRIPRAA
jgi:polysaccharide biosynthesis transport protein